MQKVKVNVNVENICKVKGQVEKEITKQINKEIKEGKVFKIQERTIEKVESVTIQNGPSSSTHRYKLEGKATVKRNNGGVEPNQCIHWTVEVTGQLEVNVTF